MVIKKRNVRARCSSGCSWVVMKSPSSVLVIRDEIHVSATNNTLPDRATSLPEETRGNCSDTFYLLFICLSLFSFYLFFFFFIYVYSFYIFFFFLRGGSIFRTAQGNRCNYWKSEMDTIQCWPPRQVHYSGGNTCWNRSAQKSSFTHPSADLDYIDMEISTPCGSPPPAPAATLFIHPLESILWRLIAGYGQYVARE